MHAKSPVWPHRSGSSDKMSVGNHLLLEIAKIRKNGLSKTMLEDSQHIV